MDKGENIEGVFHFCVFIYEYWDCKAVNILYSYLWIKTSKIKDH